MHKHGFILCVDEAGDEGIERVRPIDPEGGSEFFILAGIVYSADREAEISSLVAEIKSSIGMAAADTIHFRDLGELEKQVLLDKLASIKIGIACVVSNKRNMRGYRNRRIEDTNALWHKGRKIVPKINWFYNNLLRYLIETISIKCNHISTRVRTHKMIGAAAARSRRSNQRIWLQASTPWFQRPLNACAANRSQVRWLSFLTPEPSPREPR